MEQQVPSRFEQLMSIEQVADYLALSTKTLYGWRCRKYGPPSYRLGNKGPLPARRGACLGRRPGRARVLSRWDASRCRSGRGD